MLDNYRLDLETVHNVWRCATAEGDHATAKACGLMANAENHPTTGKLPLVARDLCALVIYTWQDRHYQVDPAGEERGRVVYEPLK